MAETKLNPEQINSPTSIAKTEDSASGVATSSLPNDGRAYLRSLLNKTLEVRLTDGRILLGQFLCIDKDANLIIGSAVEYSKENSGEPRTLGLAMIPGRHVTTIWSV